MKIPIELYSKEYNSISYNCAHFACEIWTLLGKTGLENALGGLLNCRKNRVVSLDHLKLLKRLACPQEGCLVYFHITDHSHVGIWIGGRVLHITREGVRLELLETVKVGFSKVRFFTC
jgi:hypothetical protein